MTVEERYLNITKDLPKDENGFIGTTAAEKVENMFVYLEMAVSGLSEEEIRFRHKKRVEELREQELQKSMAEMCP